MAPHGSKFQAPQLGGEVDVGIFKKLAVRVEETLQKECLFAEPKQIDPNLILVAPNNRTGSPPNTRHVHFGVLKSFKTKGFDRSRPAVGICIKFTSEQGLKKLFEHNQRFSKGSRLLPPISEGACYGSLATSHFNLALRCIKAGTFLPIGNLSDLVAESANLKEIVESGHRWWVLPETVLKEMDQNENQATHEIEILQGIKATAETLSAHQDKISQGGLVSIASRRNPSKISVAQMQVMAKMHIGFLENAVVDLVQDLVDFHSDTVDPKEITISCSFLQMLCSEEALSKCPHTRVHLIMGQYSLDKVRAQSQGPSQGALFDPGNITSLCKKTDLLQNLETKIRDIKKTYLPILEKTLSERQARLEVAVYIDLILRCLFSKPWPRVEPKVSLPVGKFGNDKIQDLGIEWAKMVDLKFPDMNFAEASGLKGEEQESQEDLKQLDLECLRELKKCSSAGPDPDLGPKFSRGDEVTVVRRMSWTIAQKNNPKFRKDIVEGTTGVIEGWADLENRCVLLTVILDLPSGKQQAITKEVFPRNLKLTSECQLAQGVPQEASGSSEGSGGKGPAKKDPYQAPDWAKGSSDSDFVKALSTFKDLLADKDKCSKAFYLKARVAVSLQSLGEVLPTYTDKDFVVVERKSDKGVWWSEVWTKRAFEPLEIQLGPWSSQLKDTHLMASAHVVVGLPKHGRGAHPENLSLAFDGRGRTSLHLKGSLAKRNTRVPCSGLCRGPQRHQMPT
jgi:hypothetical protein